VYAKIKYYKFAAVKANHLGDNCIVFENFTASIVDLMVANWVYWWRVSGAIKWIFATIKSTIDAEKSLSIVYAKIKYYKFAAVKAGVILKKKVRSLLLFWLLQASVINTTVYIEFID
jgi:hypothetical protein